MANLSDEKIAKVRNEFEYFDRDNSGELNVKEFRDMFKVIAPEARRAEADVAFGEIDENGSGLIEFDEFLDWWESNWSVY